MVNTLGICSFCPHDVTEQIYVPQRDEYAVCRADASVTHQTNSAGSIDNRSAGQTEQLITYLHASEAGQLIWKRQQQRGKDEQARSDRS